MKAANYGDPARALAVENGAMLFLLIGLLIGAFTLAISLRMLLGKTRLAAGYFAGCSLIILSVPAWLAAIQVEQWGGRYCY